MVIGRDVAGGLGVPSPMPTPTGPLVIRKRGMPELLDGWHMPLDPDLGGKLIHVRPGFGSLRAQGVDVDGLHGAVQLSDLLLQASLPRQASWLAREETRMCLARRMWFQTRSVSLSGHRRTRSI